MQNSLFKSMVIMLGGLCLTSCGEKLTYDYLVLHPAKLENAYAACQVNDAPECSDIKRAAHDVSELMYEQTMNPEAFAKNIMALQAELQDSKDKNTQEYQERLEQLNRMYAVVALHGPE